jgi:23S rRNA (cytidine1920-2'-O)/16S rRNA (cytidine1409-2'-O)-methyltransferase
VAINNCAKIVYAVDVGSNQLHKKLLNDKRVKSLENLHFKDLHLDMFTTKIDLVLADLSFISLTKLINKLVKLLPYAYQAIFLIKPEFELSPKEVIKGKVKNEKLHDKAIQKIKDYAIKNNYLVKGIIPSPIKGNKLGNSEFLIYLDKK